MISELIIVIMIIIVFVISRLQRFSRSLVFWSWILVVLPSPTLQITLVLSTLVLPTKCFTYQMFYLLPMDKSQIII